MKRLIVKSISEMVNIPVDRIERSNTVVYAYNGDDLVGAFSVEAIDYLYISEKRE